MDPIRFVALLTRFASIGNSLTPLENQHMVRLSATLQKFFLDQYQRLVTQHVDEPILIAYINDGWGRMVSDRIVKKCEASFVHVCRNGRLRHEFLLQRAVIRIDTLDNKEIVKMIVAEPIGMRLGKRAVHVFTAACEFVGTLRQMGHCGVSLNVYLQDGLLHTALTRLFQARHELYYMSGVDLGEMSDQLHDTDWTFSIKCSSHACSNSLDKAYGVIEDKAAACDELHIVTCSYINASAVLHCLLDKFVCVRLRYRQRPSGSHDQLFAFWSHFVIEPEVIDLLVQLDLEYSDGTLHVAACVESWADPWEAVSTAITYLLRWTKFIETRWCGCGKSTRYLLRSYAGGAEGLARFALEEDNTSQYHLGGIRRATTKVKLLAAIASLASAPAERLLEAFFEDDRLLLKAQEYRHLVNEEIQYLRTLDMYVWRRIAGLISEGFDIDELIHLTMKASFISVGYCWFQLFKQLDILPLSLTQGDTAQTLEAFLELDDDATLDATSLKIRRSVVVHGIPSAYIVRSLDVLKKTPCSTNLVEQGHGSGAVIMKCHEQLGELLLRARATIHSCRTLVQQSRCQQQVGRLEKRLEQFSKPGCRATKPINVFYADWKDHIDAYLVQEGCVPSEMKRRRFAHAYYLRDALAAREQADYTRRAAARSSRASAETASEIHSCRSLIDLARQRHSDELQEFGVPNHMSSCRFNDSDLSRLCSIYDALNGPTLERLQRSRFEAPGGLSKEEEALMESIAESLAPAKPAKPLWLPHVCNYRDGFQNTALLADDASGIAWAFLRASQNPRYAFFLRLQRRDVVLPSFEDMSPLEAFECRAATLREYEYTEPFRFACDVTVPFAEGGVLNVLPDLRFCQWGVFTHSVPISFEHFTACFAKPPVAPAAAPRPRKRHAGGEEVAARLRAEFPWLSDDDIKVALGKRSAKPRREHKEGEVDSDDGEVDEEEIDERPAPDDAGPDYDAESADDELEALRHDWEPEDDPDLPFRVRILGGRFTKKMKDVAGDCCKGFARFQVAKNWCTLYGWPKEKSYMFSVYGHDASVRLSSEYVRRSNFYYNVWFNGDVDWHIYTEADQIHEDDDFLNWLISQDLESESLARGIELRGLFPINR
jgi:hypothetical protein